MFNDHAAPLELAIQEMETQDATGWGSAVSIVTVMTGVTVAYFT